MDLDDSNNKTRRNLVIFSSLILGVIVLKLPLEGMLFGAIDLSKVSVHKLWFLAITILVYLIIRFHLNPSNKTPDKEWDLNKKDYTKNLLASMTNYNGEITYEIIKEKNSFLNKISVFKLIRNFETGNIEENFIADIQGLNYCKIQYRLFLNNFSITWIFLETKLPKILGLLALLACVWRLYGYI